mmetsp:Transcript_42511/g.56093  ORF Transcript_42511/g.56093 Transcript_42511/m.56093 type:complete len:86 (+) Transcript_42511:458-715(+)
MKLKRFVRDMPKHERANADFLDNLQSEVDQVGEDGQEYSDFEGDEEVRRDRLEDLFSMNGYSELQEAYNYEPVMYKLLNDIERRH